MNEYISRDAVIKSNSTCEKNCASCDFAIDGDSWCQGEIFVVDVLRIPAADVVTVVHCKDCLHWEPNDETGGFCKHIETIIENPDFFCAAGTKMDEEGDG